MFPIFRNEPEKTLDSWVNSLNMLVSKINKIESDVKKIKEFLNIEDKKEITKKFPYTGK